MTKDRLVAVENDLFSVADRIRSIDGRYRVFYNTGRGKFEVRSADDDSLQATIPYDRLDSRAVDYVRKTRIERIDEILAEIEHENAVAEKKAIEKVATQAVGNLRL